MLATDNSIYRPVPQANAFPRGTADLVRIGRLLAEPRFAGVRIAPRGGGTGTNGRSLTDGLAVDVSRHMNRNLEINAAVRWVRVEAGVVKDQLNAALNFQICFVHMPVPAAGAALALPALTEFAPVLVRASSSTRGRLRD